jgi:hypothetical protein
LKVEKASLLIRQSCRVFKASGRDKNKRPSLDFKYQKLKIVKGKNKTRAAPIRVYGLHDELMMEESGCVSQI